MQAVRGDLKGRFHSRNANQRETGEFKSKVEKKILTFWISPSSETIDDGTILHYRPSCILA